MTDKELDELSSRAREDGQRLFAVAGMLHKIALAGIILLGLMGAIGGMALIANGGGGLLAFAVTALVCWLIYLGVTLATSISRVLVHSMFCMLSTCETLRGRTSADAGAP